HPQTMDLPRQTQNRQNSRRPPSRPRIRNRPPHPQKTRTRRHYLPPRRISQNFRPQSTHRPHRGHQIQRPSRPGYTSHRSAAHHEHHHSRRRQRTSSQARRARRRSGKIHRSYDPPRLTLMSAQPNLECGGSTLLLRSKRYCPNLCGNTNFIRSSVYLFFLRILCALCVSVAIPLSSSAQQPQLNIAAASDLRFAMTELASAYEKQSGVKLNLTFGSSGNFFAQIKNGAPFDIFFSADSEYPRKLDEAGLIVPES